MKKITIYGAAIVYATITNRGVVTDLTVIGGRVDIEKPVKKPKARARARQR